MLVYDHDHDLGGKYMFAPVNAPPVFQDLGSGQPTHNAQKVNGWDVALHTLAYRVFENPNELAVTISEFSVQPFVKHHIA